MNIAIDARFYGTENGGLGRYTMNLIEQIQEIDHTNSYTILLREPWYSKLSLKPNFKKIFVHSRHYSVTEQFEIPRILNQINPDLTHFLHFNVPFFFNKPYVITIHDLLMHSGIGKEATTLPYWKYLIKRAGYRLVFDHAVVHAKHIITPSLIVKEDILQTYKRTDSDVTAIYEGVSLKKTSNSRKNSASEKYFLYVGNAYPHKNIRTLLNALSFVNVSGKEKIKLVLVTPRDVFTTRLKKEIELSNNSKLVEIRNGVTDAELHDLYLGSVAFVYPSFSEGFGLPGIEAMTCGTRLIASNIGIFKEVYQKHADYFDPHSAEDLSITMLKVLDEGGVQRKKKIAEGAEFVKRYSWEKMARATLAIYETT